MNTAFRGAIFGIEPELLAAAPALRQLAALFAELQCGAEAPVDPSAFAATLQLDRGVQQDGQEFLKLLLSLLEGVLARSVRPAARAAVQDLFRGTFSYITTCSKCVRDSDSSRQLVDFYELEVNVKGLPGLLEALDDYFADERLDGDNQYFCDHCARRADATRCVKLRSLPPAVHFQLKRFVFNPKTSTKKKVTSRFSFPVLLDLGPRLSPPPGGAAAGPQPTTVYDLAAILVHKGSMASSGHYIAHVRDEATHQWWQFDDERVACLKTHPLGEAASMPLAGCGASAESGGAAVASTSQHHDRKDRRGGARAVAASVEPLAALPPAGAPGRRDGDAEEALLDSQRDSGMLTSAEAYMLVYRRRQEGQPLQDDKQVSPPSLSSGHGRGRVATRPDTQATTSATAAAIVDREDRSGACRPLPQLEPQASLLAEVEERNQRFQADCKRYCMRREEELTRVRARQAEVRDIIGRLPAAPPGLLKNGGRSSGPPECWISIDWLRAWAEGSPSPPPIDNSVLLCRHGKLPPTKALSAKRIAIAAWWLLHERYQGGPMVTDGDFCDACLLEDAHMELSADSFRAERATVQAKLEGILKAPSVREPGDQRWYYVSKNWCVASSRLLLWLRRTRAELPVDADRQPTRLLTCEHGALLPEQAPNAKRQAVPEDIWHFLHLTALQAVAGSSVMDKTGNASGAPNVAVFPEGSEECMICQARMSTQENLRAMMTLHKQRHEALYLARLLPLRPGRKYALVPMWWVGRWRVYLNGLSGKHARAPEPPWLQDAMAPLLCEKHGRLMQKPPQLVLRRNDVMQRSMRDDDLTVVTEEDWLGIAAHWGADEALRVEAFLEAPPDAASAATCEGTAAVEAPESTAAFKVAAPGGANGDAGCVPPATNGLLRLQTKPEICTDCLRQQELAELESRLHFEDAEIMVELAFGKEPPSSSAASAAAAVPPQLGAAAVGSGAEAAEGERRSRRVRKASAMTGGRISLRVSWAMLVGQLKMLIWESLGVTKDNQRLGIGSMELADDDASLAACGISPGSHLWVVDTGRHEDRDIAEELPSGDLLFEDGAMEEGFKGTGLLGGAHLPPVVRELKEESTVGDSSDCAHRNERAASSRKASSSSWHDAQNEQASCGGPIATVRKGKRGKRGAKAAAVVAAEDSSPHAEKGSNGAANGTLSTSRSVLEGQGQGAARTCAWIVLAEPAEQAKPRRATVEERAVYALDYFFATHPMGKARSPLPPSAAGASLPQQLALTVVGGVAYRRAASESGDAVNTPASMWAAWTFVADAGTHAGEDTVPKRVVAVPLTLAGMLFFALLVGLMSDAVSGKVDELQKGASLVIESDHTLVIDKSLPFGLIPDPRLAIISTSARPVLSASLAGWSRKTVPLVKQLAVANKARQRGQKRAVVVLGEEEKVAMDAALLEALPVVERHGTKVVTRPGAPTVSEDLRRCSAGSARSIVVLSPDGLDADQADAKVLQACLVLGHVSGIRADVVAEFQELDNVSVLQSMHATILGDAGSLMRERQQGKQGLVRGNTKRFEHRQGWDVSKMVPVATGDLAFRIMVERALRPGTSSVLSQLLAFDGSEFHFKHWPELVGKRFGDILFLFKDAVPCGIRKRSTTLVNPPPETLFEEGDRLLVIAEDDASYKPGPSNAPNFPYHQSRPTHVQPKTHMLLCGFRPNFPNILRLLDSSVARGSQVTMLADPQYKETIKDLDLSRRLKNVTLKIRYGAPHSRQVLEKLPLEQYDRVIIIKDDQLPSSSPTDVAMYIRHIQASRGNPEATIVAEVEGKGGDALQQVQRTWLDDAIFPEELEAMVLAHLAEDADVGGVLDQVISETGSELVLRSVLAYAEEGEQARAMVQREIIVAYRNAGQSADWALNPPNKDLKLRWHRGDELVVLTQGN
eukprot:SM000167S02947  [mRNA]  locus=s167:54297:65845:- [translate_table: standard]